MRTDDEKQEYSTIQNMGWIVKKAWKTRKSLMFYYLILGVTGLSLNLLELYIAPKILSEIEIDAPLRHLVHTILLFSLGLILIRAIQAYINENTIFGEVDFEKQIYLDQNYKAATTSYPNIKDPAKLNLAKQASEIWRVFSGTYEEHGIWEQISLLLEYVFGFLIYLHILSALPWYLLVLVLLSAIGAYLITRYLQRWEKDHLEEQSRYKKMLDYLDRKSGDISLGKDIRLFGMQNWIEEMYSGTVRMYYHFMERLGLRMFLIDFTEILLSFIRNGFAYFFLIRMVLADHITVSQFLLYFTAFTGLTAWVTGILQKLALLHRFSYYISAHRSYMNMEEPFLFEEGKTIPEPKEGKYQITLKNVSFRYPGAEEDTINNIDLVVDAGEKVAVVGRNGAGKTTLIKLISGLYDPTDGKVLLNGVDIRQYNRREYYALFKTVFQTSAVFPATIAENVSCDIYDPKEDKIIRCLEQAGLQKKIDALPDGIHTHLGKEVYDDGISLSGGETQRLLLARALFREGSILILDEPTAALDPIAENEIYLHYNEMTASKTSFFVSHRLASTRFCDRILLLDQGRIVEQGTHEELLASNGSYADLFEVQSRYYREKNHEE